jgi:hypothetical protein
MARPSCDRDNMTHAPPRSLAAPCAGGIGVVLAALTLAFLAANGLM